MADKIDDEVDFYFPQFNSFVECTEFLPSFFVPAIFINPPPPWCPSLRSPHGPLGVGTMPKNFRGIFLKYTGTI